jgi:membrane associated rhomboid family serine protease
MFYEYALISVVIASGYWAYYFLRHQPHGTALFGLMQLAAAAMAGLGLLGRHYEHPTLGIFGAIGLGAGLCLLVVGPFVRGVARRFAASERTAIASRLLDVAEILAPGSGVAEEKALIGAMKEIREGRVEQAVDALTAAKTMAPAEARVAIDERIAMLYLAAYRWRDAITYAEANLPTILQPIIRDEPEPPAEAATDDRRLEIIASGTALRNALGVAAPVWIELLGAYGRTGNLDQAARMMAQLEEACEKRDEASLWLHRARMMFLALAGRPDAVRTLVDRKRARHMSAAARMYWVAVALQHHGDLEGAGAAFQQARSRSRGRPRDLIDEAIARLPATEKTTPSPAVTEVIERIEAAPLPAPIRLPRQHGPWATWGLTASLVGVAALIAWLAGSTSDPGVLLRAGAMVRGRIEDGEWWRLISCVFVHVGPVHLAVNAIGIYFLGRICEELFGTSRTLAIFGIAGVAGATASCLASPSGVSAGASGAIFGVLGALFIELTLHRTRYRSAWHRGLWGRLVVVTVAQAGIGFVYPVIDQWAHGVGLVTGIALGAALSPNVRWAKLGLAAARSLAVVFVGVALFAGVMVANTSIADSFGRVDRVRYELREVAVTAPAGWVVSNRELFDPDKLVILKTVRETIKPKDTPPVLIAEWIIDTERDAKARGFDRVEATPTRLITPAGWEGSERIGTLEDAMGHVQRWRVVALGKDLGGEMLKVLLYLPDSVAHAAPALFAEIIASVGPR